MIIHRWLLAGIMFWTVALVKGVEAQNLPRVMIRTELGSMEVEVDTIGSPDAAANFLNQVDQGVFQGARFYRTIRAERLPGGKAGIEGIQGGLNPSRPKDVAPMVLERKKDTGLALADGDKVLSGGQGPNASSSEFFIRAGDQSELGRLEADGQGFTPFGRVVRGREVVRLIHTARARDHRLTPPVGILEVRRVE